MPSRIALAVAAAALALSMTACGADETPVGSAPTAAQPTGGGTASAAPADDCGGVAAAIEAVVASDALEAVEVVGQCTTVSIDTSLADGDEVAAKEICEAAAKVAYVGDVNSIRVSSATGAELAQGIAGARCI